MSENVGYGVLDTACTETVAETSLTEPKRASIRRSERSKQSAYRFGDGVEPQNIKIVHIPKLLPGNKKVEQEADIMNNQIPEAAPRGFL